MELASFAVGRMLVAAIGEKQLAMRIARKERHYFEAMLAKEPDARLGRIANELGVPSKYETREVGGTSLEASRTEYLPYFDLADYLALPELTDSEWKLVVRLVSRGRVYIPKKHLAEACARRIGAQLESMYVPSVGEKFPADLHEALDSLIDPLQSKIESARGSWSSGDFGPVQPDLFPPCIKEIFEALKRKENVPHHGRFAMATFLNTIGWGSEQILDYLSTTPNFDREKSRYQIEHVTGQKGVQAYTPPGCATMQTNGVCPLDKRDKVCFTIKHPLGYYRKQLRRQQWLADRATANVQPPIPPMAPNQGASSVESVKSVAPSEAKP